MGLLKFFEHNVQHYITLVLDEDDWDAFIEAIAPYYKSAYISDTDLNRKIVELNSDSATEFIEILPDRGNIKAGDFGEILAYLLFKERHKGRNVDGPKKWRWKQDKNMAAPFTDVILYSMKHERASTDDLLISIESKMKATASQRHPIQDAIDGAEKDYVSRIANSLGWIRKKYKDEILKVGANKVAINNVIKIINRYIQSETYGPYSKKVKAVAIIDSAFFQVEIAKNVNIPTIPGLDLTIFAVSINDLQEAYESVFEKIPTL